MARTPYGGYPPERDRIVSGSDVKLREFLGEKIANLDQKLEDKTESLNQKIDSLIQDLAREREYDRKESAMASERLRKAEVAIAILQWGYALGAIVAMWWVYERSGAP